MKIILLIVAMLTTAAGAAYSFQTRNQYVKAALYSEGFALSEPVREKVQAFYDLNGSFPHDNVEAELPPAHVLFGTSVETISVVRDGVVLVAFKEGVTGGVLEFSPDVDMIRGLTGWSCSSDSIDKIVLEKFDTPCTYIPATAESQLLEAIAHQDIASIKELLSQAIDLEKVISGNTPMMLAAKIGNDNIVRFLIDAGASVDHRRVNTERRTPLMVAISSDRADIAVLLLSEGASIERKDYSGKSAVDYARKTDKRNGNERFELILAAQLNPLFAGRPRNASRRTTVQEEREKLLELYSQFEFAISTCHVKRIASLLEANDDLAENETVDGFLLAAITEKPRCTSELSHFVKTKATWKQAFVATLEVAISNCGVETVHSMLSENPELDIADSKQGESLLFRAVRAGCFDVLQIFLRDQRLSGKLDATLLIKAISEVPQSSLLRTVNVLIQAGADVNAVSKHGETPLLTAISFEQPVVAKYLIDAGADPSTPVANGSWALIEATQKGYFHLVVQLIKKGINVNATDKLGRTALHAAVAKRSKRIVNVLLNAGANPRIQDVHGMDAVLMASTNRNDVIYSLLSEVD